MKVQVAFTQDLRRNPYKGLYIAIEGIDGSGKSTQIKALSDQLKTASIPVVTIHEPNDNTYIGNLIRNTLNAKVALPSRAFQSLFSADRALNHASLTEPALEKGNIVLSHRSNWTTIPYGIEDIDSSFTVASAYHIGVANGLLSYYHQFIIPDMTFYLDVSLETVMKRMLLMKKERDIYEQEKKLKRVLNGYHSLLQKFPKEFIVINGESKEELVTKTILKQVVEKFKAKTR